MRIRIKPAMVLIAVVLLFSAAAGALGCTTAKTNLPVVLFSDYGSGDYRTLHLKGAILTCNPDAVIIDASQEIPSFDIATGAFMLSMAAREFPGKMVFVVVVAAYYRPDPRYLVLTTSREQVFIAPDNGLLTYVIQEYGIKSLYNVDNQKLFDQPISRLSSERVEGTVGARVSTGYKVEDIGAAVTQPTVMDIQQPVVVDHQLLGTIIFVDNFGNCITNIPASTAGQFGLTPGKAIQVQTPKELITARYGTIYSDVPQGKEIAFVLSNLGVVQLSINLGNFSLTYDLKAGSRINLQKVAAVP
jgi:S-adenosylmethionine hydrolase